MVELVNLMLSLSKLKLRFIVFFLRNFVSTRSLGMALMGDILVKKRMGEWWEKANCMVGSEKMLEVAWKLVTAKSMVDETVDLMDFCHVGLLGVQTSMFSHAAVSLVLFEGIYSNL